MTKRFLEHQLFKIYSATVCFGGTLGFFLVPLLPHQWIQLAWVYVIIGAFIIIFDLWLSDFLRGKKVLWTVLIVVLNVIAMPFYWITVIRKRCYRETIVTSFDCHYEKWIDESIACGVLAIFIGPFASLPGIFLSHLAYRHWNASTTMGLKGKIAFALNYGVTTVWVVLLILAAREFYSVA